MEVYAQMHIECAFRNHQNRGDDFELYLGPDIDPFWLSREEVEQLVERANAALAAYDRANSVLRSGVLGSDEPVPDRRDPTETEK